MATKQGTRDQQGNMCIVVDADLHVLCLDVFALTGLPGCCYVLFFFASLRGCFVQCTSLWALLYVQVFAFVVFCFLPVCRVVFVGAVAMLFLLSRQHCCIYMSVAWSGDIKVHFDLLWPSTNTYPLPFTIRLVCISLAGNIVTVLSSDVDIKRVLYSRL